MNHVDQRLHNAIVKCNNEIWRLRCEIDELEQRLKILDEIENALWMKH